MNATTTSSDPLDLNVKGDLAEPHEPHWISRSAFQILACCLYAVQASLFLALYYNITWLVVLLLFPASHLMHGVLIGFHEASHGLLRKNRRFNEFDGVFIGILSLTSFSLYRAAHQTHHMHLATERDEELWPFVDPKSPRWFRRLAAFLELTFGLWFTPYLFLRTFFRKNSPIRNKRVRKRIWQELIGIVAFWTVVLTAVAWFGLWKYYFCMYLIPAMFAANMQSWRKYVEHVGLSGTSATGATRSIVDEGLTGKILAYSLLHEPFHGLHHRHLGIHHWQLPHRASELTPTTPEETAPYPSYRLAVMDLIRDLADPKVGPHWRTETNASASPASVALPG
ncbi:fatty acid desaturase [Prosthecobacter fusiformis]|uniref:Fatty acid desaturase n=1 Tax=Prosthecobacter fusiformis TaxID=48464 RepID=A0A4R7SSN7_9BACT|nr:fatty acid desaturase [Prosthecobacter fusiformis]TDU81699.1 fatty acid desaturase [Prosthecobacter fusiformis]